MSDGVVYEYVTVIEPSLMGFLETCKAKWQDGWELDPEHGPQMIHFQYKTLMRRDAEHAQAEADRIAAGKPSRAEILAAARAAKAAKAAAQAQESANV